MRGNAYGLWFANGEAETWVRRRTWGRHVVRLIAMDPPLGPPPYYGNCGFQYEVYGPEGLVTDWAEVTQWGNYGWVLVRDPEGLGVDLSSLRG